MKKIKYLLFISILLIYPNTFVSAASGSISVSSSNTVVGNSGRATLTISSPGDPIGQIYGTFSCGALGSVDLSFSANSPIEKKEYTISWTAKTAGTYTCSVSQLEVGLVKSTSWPTIGVTSKTINVVSGTNSNNGNTQNNDTTEDKAKYSSDNNLSSLSIDGYDLEPKFDKDKTKYTLEVDSNVEKINVNAKPNDSKATVTGTGEKTLSDGENTIDITVTAENGNEKKYTIIVTVKDKNPINVKIKNGEYTLVKSNNGLLKELDGYEKTTIKIDGQDVLAYYNNKNNITLVILKNKNNKYAYYIYKDNEYKLYKELEFKGSKIMILDMPKNKIPYGYKKYSFKYNEKNYNGYKIHKNSSHYIIYAMNIENGKEDLYIYDQKTKSIIQYDKKADIYYKDKYKNNEKLYESIIIGIIGFDLIVIIILIILSIKKNKNKRHR